MKDVVEAILYGIVIAAALWGFDSILGVTTHSRLGWGPSDWIWLGGALALANFAGRRWRLLT